jgi:4-amino-4-deoxy-L-arabinose transferase-like glycosyltransferase
VAASVRLGYRLGLLAVVAAAVLMRMPGLLHDGLWRDQANAYVQLAAPTFGEFLHRVTETEWHPPLYFLINYVWIKLAGESELAFTLLPFIFSIATVPILYALAKTVATSLAGLVAALLYAVAPMAVAYGGEYLYPLMGLLATLLTLLVAAARRSPPNAARLAAIALVALCAVYTHYTSLIFIPLLAIWSLWPQRGYRSSWTAMALIAGALPFAAWLGVFTMQRRIGIPYQWPPLGLAAKAEYVYTTTLQFMPARPERLEIALLAIAGGAFAVLVARRGLNSSACALGAIFFAMLTLTTAVNLTTPRYVVAYYPLLCAFEGWLAVAIAAEVRSQLDAGRRRFVLPIAALIGTVFLVGDVQTMLERSSAAKSGIRAFAASHSLSRATLYVIAPDYLAPTFDFYARGASFRGFVRWRHPEIFRLEGYAAAWNAPSAVARALRAIAGESGTYRELDLVLDDSAHDEGRIPYGKAQQLLREMRARYRLLGYSRYAGRLEPISVYRFKLTTT